MTLFLGSMGFGRQRMDDADRFSGRFIFLSLPKVLGTNTQIQICNRYANENKETTFLNLLISFLKN
jgi:hypothetical protein